MNKYTIKEIASSFDIPASTLRYYEDIGILTNVERTVSGQRIYREHHVNRLKSICCFKGTGMSIAKLQAFFSYEEKENEHIDDILTLLGEQKNSVAEQLIQLQKDLDHVNKKLLYYSDIKTAIVSDSPLPSWDKYKK